MDSSSSSSAATAAAAGVVAASTHRYSYNPSLIWNPEVEEYFIKAYGANHFARISESLTRPSSYSCIRVNILKSTTYAVFEKLTKLLREGFADGFDVMSTERLPEGNENDEGFQNGMCQGIFKLCLEGTCEDREKKENKVKRHGIYECQLPGLDYILFVRGSGPHHILYGNQLNRCLKEVIVSRKCAESVLRGAQVFVPGVLACSSHVEKGDVVAVSVAIEQPNTGGWGVGITRGAVLQGSETDPQYLERKGMYIGQGITQLSRAGIFRASEGVAVEMTNRVYRLPSFHDLLKGEIFLQNLPSIIAAHVLEPQQGERILDMCAAPGGKTTAIAMLMRDNGEVVALDRSHNKVIDIKRLAAEMDLTSIRAFRLDALKSVCQNDQATHALGTNLKNATFAIEKSILSNVQTLSANPGKEKTDVKQKENGNGRCLGKSEMRKSSWRIKNGPGRNHSTGARAENSKGFLPNSFDRVLLDAPCSALGLRPRLFAAEETMESLQTHCKYQRRMFDQAVQLVRSGGIIVYSTCTINPGENEALVRYALDTYKFLSLVPQNPRIGGPGLVGKCELFGNKHTEMWLTESEAQLVQRFDPSAALDTIGFFIAKFIVGNKDS